MDWDCTPSPTAGPEAARLRVVSAVNLSREVELRAWKALPVNLHHEKVRKRLMEKYQRVIAEEKVTLGSIRG